MGGLLNPQVTGLLGEFDTYEVKLKDGTKVTKQVPRGASDQTIRSLFGLDMRKRGIDVGAQAILDAPPRDPSSPPPFQPSGTISEYRPNFSERIGWALSDGLQWFGMKGEEAWEKGVGLTNLLHDWTPIGNFDGLVYPTSELDRQLSALPLPGPGRRIAKAAGGRLEDGAEALGRSIGRGLRGSVPARPRTPDEVNISRHPQRSFANHSWESAPGKTTGHMQGLGIHSKAAKAKYHGEAKDVFLTPNGHSRIARGYGLNTGRSFDNVGYYKGEFSPGTQDRVAVTIGPRRGKPDERSVAAMNNLGATQGLLGAQDAMAWNHFTPTDDLAGASAIKFSLGRPMSEQDIRRYEPLINDVFRGRAGMLPDEDGFRIARFDDEAGLPSVAEFVERLRASDPQLREVPIIPGIHSSNYLENDWAGKGRFGADYGRALLASPTPDIGKRFDAAAPRIAEALLKLDPETASRHGLKSSEDIELLRKTIAEKGWDGFMALIKEGKLPAVLAPFVLGMAGLGGEEPDRQGM